MTTVDASVESAKYAFATTTQCKGAGMKGILFGEKGEKGAPRIHVHFPGLGHMEAITEEGCGYKAENEDAIAWAKAPNGDVFLIDIDGMGGYANGKDAARFAAVNLVEFVINGKAFDRAVEEVDLRMRQMFPEAGAAFVAAQISSASTAGDPPLARVYWAGDARLLILRKNENMEWHWIYRSSDDSWAKEVIDSAIDEGTNEPSFRTQDISLHPMGNILTNGLGKTDYQLNTTQHGEVPCDDADSLGYTTAEHLDTIPLQPGDLVVLFSDGVGDNYLKTQHLMHLLATAENEKEVANRIYRESIYNMTILEKARNSRVIERGQRYSFTYKGLLPHLRGKKLWADAGGTVWDHPDDGSVATKLKADNISVMTLMVSDGETAGSQTPSKRSWWGWLRSWFSGEVNG